MCAPLPSIGLSILSQGCRMCNKGIIGNQWELSKADPNKLEKCIIGLSKGDHPTDISSIPLCISNLQHLLQSSWKELEVKFGFKNFPFFELNGLREHYIIM